MNVLAALGDAPTAAIAVLAIMLGLFVVARGQRGQRAGADESGPTLLKVPVAAPGAAATMAVGDIGHGTIRLGGVASSPEEREADAISEAQATEASAPEPAGDAVAAAEAEPAPAEPEPEPEPAPVVEAPDSWTSEPAAPAPDEPPAATQSEPPPEPEPERKPEPPVWQAQAPPPPAPSPPAWQTPPSARNLPFRQGTIKLRKPGGQ